MSAAEHLNAPRGRETSPAIRTFLLVAGCLALIAGVQTFIFATTTAENFAWTIAVPLSAAFLGAGYFAGAVLEFLGTRERYWATARMTVLVVWVFSTVALIFTIMHIDRFHHTEPAWNTALAAWVWFFLYVVVPPLLLFLIVRQERQPGADIPRENPLPAAWWVFLVASSAVLLVSGAALFLFPETMNPLWPWDLTPLTSRAIGTWLFAIGFALAHAAWDNDRARIGAGARAYTVFAVLELVAVARFHDFVHWDRPGAWLYVAFLALAVILGAYGSATSRALAAA